MHPAPWDRDRGALAVCDIGKEGRSKNQSPSGHSGLEAAAGPALVVPGVPFTNYQTRYGP
jgi:hypothetical protein